MPVTINAVTAAAESLSGIMDSMDGLITSKEERMTQDNRLQEIRNELANIQKEMYSRSADVEESLINAKAKIINSEVNGNKLQRNWRPILMLCFGGIIIYQFFLVHLINALYAAFSSNPELFIQPFDLPNRFWTLLEIGVGGYIAGRSLEKITPNVVKTIMEQKETRRMSEEIKTKQEARNQRQERRQDRWERRQDRKDERLEARLEKTEVGGDMSGGKESLTKKQQRQQRRLERKARGENKLKPLFK